MFRQFYLVYSDLHEAVFELVNATGNQGISEIMQIPSAQIGFMKKEEVGIVQTASAQLSERTGNYLIHIIQRISFSHFVELLNIKDKTKRVFYELLILKTTPSVKELQRQINTLAYERVGLSASTEAAFEQLQGKIEPEQVSNAVKSIFLFDFLGLKTDELVEESELETSLLSHLQEFLLELGHGFCFEARQQRILIDDEYYFVDLVFYHRILKCHVLVELKMDAFRYEHLSQLNTYVAYYREEVKRPDDNLPIGILLCTEKGKKRVEYALSGMDNQLFVSTYLLELPKKEQLEAFILNELKKWNQA